VERFRAKPITEAKAVKSVVEKFREKYGARDVKKYYSTFDVAVVVHRPELECHGALTGIAIEAGK